MKYRVHVKETVHSQTLYAIEATNAAEARKIVEDREEDDFGIEWVDVDSDDFEITKVEEVDPCEQVQR